jgi:enoyl-CoA hydratase/carnithine racemase
MTTAPLLHIEQRDEVVLLRLDRPDKRNAINNQLIAEFAALFAAPPEGMRVIVLHASGAHFCAGLDLMEMLAQPPRNAIEGQRRSRAWHRVFDHIQFGEVPVVSVLQGAVVGGGMELASATHVRVVERSAFFQLPEGQRGIFVGGSGAVRIPRIIGAGRMVEMMLTGRQYSADEALQLGLAHYTVDDGAGLDKALQLARQIATNAPTSNYAVINGIARVAEMGYAEGLTAESFITSATGADAAKRIHGFFDGRKPVRETTGAD